MIDDHVQPGYEDVWYYLWRERRLPINVDPFDARLGRRSRARPAAPRLHAAARRGRRLRAAAAAGRMQAVGWRTGPWFLRSERLYLHPGDSPMGFRLPLDSLPWAAEGDLPQPFEPDPLTPRRRCALDARSR